MPVVVAAISGWFGSGGWSVCTSMRKKRSWSSRISASSRPRVLTVVGGTLVVFADAAVVGTTIVVGVVAEVVGAAVVSAVEPAALVHAASPAT